MSRKYMWMECNVCWGRGKKWPQGENAPAERCEICRGIGRLCTMEAGPEFDKATGRKVPQGVLGAHPIGDCLSCCGMVQEFYAEHLHTRADVLDLADKHRSQVRLGAERLLEQGERHEENLRALVAEQVKLQLEAAGVQPKQLGSGVGGPETSVAVPGGRKKGKKS